MIAIVIVKISNLRKLFPSISGLSIYTFESINNLMNTHKNK